MSSMKGFSGFGYPFLSVVSNRHTLNITRMDLGYVVGLVDGDDTLRALLRQGKAGDGPIRYFECRTEAEAAAAAAAAAL